MNFFRVHPRKHSTLPNLQLGKWMCAAPTGEHGRWWASLLSYALPRSCQDKKKKLVLVLYNERQIDRMNTSSWLSHQLWNSLKLAGKLSWEPLTYIKARITLLNINMFDIHRLLKKGKLMLILFFPNEVASYLNWNISWKKNSTLSF